MIDSSFPPLPPVTPPEAAHLAPRPSGTPRLWVALLLTLGIVVVVSLAVAGIASLVSHPSQDLSNEPWLQAIQDRCGTDVHDTSKPMVLVQSIYGNDPVIREWSDQTSIGPVIVANEETPSGGENWWVTSGCGL